MNPHNLRLAALGVTILFPFAAAAADGGLIKLKAALDEPEYYCLDVPGWGRNLNLKAPLMAHACKPGADDEIFQTNRPNSGQLSMPAYSLCVQADKTEAGAAVRMTECSDSTLQKFSWSNGHVSPAGDATLCLAVADAKGEPTGGPSHLKLDLTLQPCASVSAARSEWLLP